MFPVRRHDSASPQEAAKESMAKACRRCEREFTDLVSSCPEHGKELVPFTDSRMRPGDVVDRYVVLNRVGAGGAGDVYRARRADLEQVVALKLLRTRTRREAERFENEARVLSRVTSPHIVRLGERGIAGDGRPYLIMPLVPGRTLRQVIQAEAPLGPVRAARLMGQVARAVEALHAAGVAHLDLKPTNIMVTPDAITREHVTLVDFGIALDPQDALSARLRVPGAGTPGYLSPEQAAGDVVDTRSDLWSLGAILHELLTGERAFAYDDARAAMDGVRHAQVRPIRESHPGLRVPSALDELLLALLSDDPASRPGASRVREALDAIVTAGWAGTAERGEGVDPDGTSTSQDGPAASAVLASPPAPLAAALRWFTRATSSLAGSATTLGAALVRRVRGGGVSVAAASRAEVQQVPPRA